MEIKVTVEDIDLKVVIGDRWDDEGERVNATLGDRIAEEIVNRIMRDAGWRDFVQHVQDIRDEEIRTSARAEIAAAITKPFKKTNPFGEETGETTTLRESIAKQAREVLLSANKGGYNMSREAEDLSKLIKREAANAVTTLLKKEMEEEITRLREVMREKAVQLIAGDQSKK